MSMLAPAVRRRDPLACHIKKIPKELLRRMRGFLIGTEAQLWQIHEWLGAPRPTFPALYVTILRGCYFIHEEMCRDVLDVARRARTTNLPQCHWCLVQTGWGIENAAALFRRLRPCVSCDEFHILCIRCGNCVECADHCHWCRGDVLKPCCSGCLKCVDCGLKAEVCKECGCCCPYCSEGLDTEHHCHTCCLDASAPPCVECGGCYTCDDNYVMCWTCIRCRFCHCSCEEDK